MNVLGINAYHGDSSAALLIDGRVAMAIEEERLNRIKHWAGYPALAVEACLAAGAPAELAHVAISRNPRAHVWRKVAHAAKHPSAWPRFFSRATNSVRIARFHRELAHLPGAARVHHVEHHRAHMASAFFVSPFEEAAVVSVDGFGDFSSVMWGRGTGNSFQVSGAVHFPHSLGAFYTAFTQFLGFPKYGDEYKMMGLAAYGEPRFATQVRDVVRTVGGACRLNLDYFTHHSRGVDMSWDGGEPVLGSIFSNKMIEVFGNFRAPRTEVLPQHADLAASVQLVLEENYFALLNHVHAKTGQKAVCLAGGVALNCAANGKIFEHTPFKDIYVQPAANDAGTAIGAAAYVWHQMLGKPRREVMRQVYLGPEQDAVAIRRDLEAAGTTWSLHDERALLDKTARAISEGKIVGWYQGRMEFGPRALGNRSILADPRRRDMKDILNGRIKYREHFRPFCPSILAESARDYFETDYPSPFMVMAYRIKPDKRESIPAVTHQDGTGRLQTVEQDANPLYWKLIQRFAELTSVPVLLNTSFNENEPIVNTPAQAIDCFLRTQMDALVIGPYYLSKEENANVSRQSADLARQYSSLPR
jgi:carbamoyltransferase